MRLSAKLAAATGLVALTAALGGADAPAARIAFSGCPTPGVENACMLVTGGGKTWNVSSAKPPIELKGLGVAGTGVPGGMSSCMQGVVLTDIKYAYTKERCPAPKPAASAY